MAQNTNLSTGAWGALWSLAMLLVASCAGGSSRAPAGAPTLTAAAPSSLMQSVRIVRRSLSEDQPDLLRPLIGDEGVAAAPFAVGGQFEGNDNSDEIVALFAEALEGGQPVCLGYDPAAGSLPDKALLIYRRLAIDWSRLGLGGVDTDGMTIQLFNLPEGWRFVYITPFDLQAGAAYVESLQECP